MVFMPPQHGKSELVSRQLPAYILGKDPKAKIIVASYSASLSSSFNRDCQRIIDSPAYAQVFPDTKLSSSNVVTMAGNWLRNSEIFEVVGQGGFLKSVGVGGSLTGTPADYAIIDDPVKDSIEAMSPTYQQRNWDWYNDVFYTRIHNDTRILITQTRWDVNDLSGKLLDRMEESGGEQWTVLCIPAVKIADGDPEDPRNMGDALWPARHSLEKLHQIRNQSIRTFEALYQQNPKPTQAGGEFYKEFRPERHIQKLSYNPAIALHISFDFNVNPYMTCTIWQLNGKQAHQIDEICLKAPRNTTTAICREFIRKYPGHGSGLFVYGDPNGKREDTRNEAGYNDYTIIQRELLKYKPSLRVLDKAPSVVMRANFINTILATGFMGIEIAIDQKCNISIEDFTYLKEDSDGTKFKQKAKDAGTGAGYEKYGHTSDSADYFLAMAFMNEFVQYQKGGLGGKTSYGKNAPNKNAY